jgi:hypothetical protein
MSFFSGAQNCQLVCGAAMPVSALNWPLTHDEIVSVKFGYGLSGKFWMLYAPWEQLPVCFDREPSIQGLLAEINQVLQSIPLPAS